jgi:hypothetical protein
MPLMAQAHPAAASEPSPASISLQASSVTMAQTSSTAWTLTKTGSVDASSNVTWLVTATQGSTVAGKLTVNGTLTVTNNGSGGATVGNIVVNLQGRQNNTWVTKSSDIADATHDDAATEANVVASASSEGLSHFSENAASGSLVFMDAANNSMFSLVPQVTIPGGATRVLKFTATYDNNVLHLANGAQVRVESIVTFGNASNGAATATNVDINGNGTIDSDETRVRSVPSRITTNVPAQVPDNGTVTLTDTLADIVATGTVTFSNTVFNLGPNGGTVTTHIDGGTSGGTITNCAHLDGSGGSNLHLQACDTETVGGHSCEPGAPGCGWVDGDVITYNQDSWDQGAAGGTTLEQNFFSVYPSGVVEVGIPGSGGFSMGFLGYSYIFDYFSAGGPNGPLTSDLINPTSTSSGEFGGDVLALQLDVDFSDAGFTIGTSGLRFGDLTLCGLTTPVNGMSVRDFLAVANTLLGGGSNGYDISDIGPLTVLVDTSFNGGAATSFAQAHLINGNCP